jgi:preprotein translocase subunit SecG
MQVLNIFHVLIAIALVAFVLIQKGQGATAGAAFGSGASGTVFGARGAGNFLTRSTWVLATLFCAISLAMAVLVSRVSAQPENDLGVIGSAGAPPAVEVVEQNNEVSVSSEDPMVTDVPALEVTGEDLPLPEANTISEEAQRLEDGAVENGEDRSEPGDGGS